MADTKRSLFCPACGEEMSKIYIKSADCYIDVCINGCGGIYFDKNELQKINGINDDIPELIEALRNKDFMLIDEERARMCPVCSHIMTKLFSTENREVEIDECHACKGIFLDYNELFKIRNEQKDDDVAKNINKSNFIKELNTYFDTENSSKKSHNKFNRELFNRIINTVYNK